LCLGLLGLENLQLAIHFAKFKKDKGLKYLMEQILALKRLYLKKCIGKTPLISFS